MQTFTFQHADEFSYTEKEVTIPEDAKWPAAIAACAEFLSAVYGYDIKDRLVVKVGDRYAHLRQHVLDEALSEGL